MHGMDLVLANKRPLAGRRGVSEALWQTARARGRRVLHEATVGAGLPIIDTYHKLTESGDRVERIEGLLSGTLGYVLSEVVGGNAVLATRCARRCACGYTEPDPREDLSGMDVGRKALILARLLGYPGRAVAHGGGVAGAEVGARPAAGRVPRAAGRARRRRGAGGWRRPRPTAWCCATWRRSRRRRSRSASGRCPASSPLAAIKGSDNQLVFTTARYKANPLVITGPGAGAEVTAAGRAQRHPSPGGRMTRRRSASPPSRPGGVGNVGPGLDILGLAVDGAGDTVRAEWTREAGIDLRDPGHPSLPRDPARHTSALAARAVLAAAGERLAGGRGIALSVTQGSAALGRPGRQRRLGGGGRGGGQRAAGQPARSSTRCSTPASSPRRRWPGATSTTSRRRCSAASC